MNNFFYFYLLIAALMAYLPYFLEKKQVIGRKIINFFKTIFEIPNTLVHEIFHALFTILTRNKVQKINLYHTGAGVAISQAKGRIRTSIIAIVGYTGASAFSVLCVYWVYLEKYFFVLLTFALLTIISLVLWTRNIYGILWSIGFILVLLYLIINEQGIFSENILSFLSTYAARYLGESFILFLPETLAFVLTKHIALFLTAVCVVQAVYSAFVIMKLSFEDSKNAGDATLLAQKTKIPAVVWGVFFFIQACYAVYFIIKNIIL